MHATDQQPADRSPTFAEHKRRGRSTRWGTVLAVMALIASSVLMISVVAAGPASAASTGLHVTCDSSDNIITVSGDDNHMWAFKIERWNSRTRTWDWYGGTGWHYLSTAFGYDAWGRAFSNGYYRVQGQTYDLRWGSYDWASPGEINFWADGRASVDSNGNAASWCGI